MDWYNLYFLDEDNYCSETAKLELKGGCDHLKVKKAVSIQPVLLHPNDEIVKAARIFQVNLFHALPIVDEQDSYTF